MPEWRWGLRKDLKEIEVKLSSHEHFRLKRLNGGASKLNKIKSKGLKTEGEPQDAATQTEGEAKPEEGEVPAGGDEQSKKEAGIKGEKAEEVDLVKEFLHLF